MPDQVLHLSPKQTRFVYQAPGVSLYRGAIASGKTYAGAAKTISRRERYPGTIQIIGGPSWDQLRDGTMRTLDRLTAALRPPWVTYRNDSAHIWRLHNGSELIFRTLDDPDVLRALEAHDLWIDEIALCGPQVLDVGLGRIRLEGCPNEAWGTTTPRGMDWTLDAWGETGKPGWPVVHSTIYENYYILPDGTEHQNLPEGYIERLEEKYRDTPFFDQELLGLYTAFEGLVYPMFLREKHVTAPACPVWECERIIVGGPDWGGAMPSAMYLIGERHGRAHVYREFYRTGADLADIAATLDDWVQESRVRKKLLRIDYDGAETVSGETLRREKGFSAARAADKDREGGIKLVQERLNGDGRGPLLTISPECTSLIGEFGQYIWASKRDATTKVMFRTNTPIDHHADGLDALRYGCMGLRTPVAVDRMSIGTAVSRYGGGSVRL